MNKYILNFIVVLFFSVSNAFAEAPEVEKYVHTLITDSLGILNESTLNAKVREQKVRAMLSQNLDAVWMGRFSLGREVKTLPAEKLQKFLDTYIKYVVSSYSNAINSYKGEKVKVKSVDTLSGDFFMVKSNVVKADGNVINVDYLVHKVNGVYKVCDIITEGISLVNSQRSEYGGIINNTGVDNLIAELAKRTSE
jgi:phospholipid transport system substrate-binding protein